MKTHLAYVYKNVLQTYYKAGFFWLKKKSKQIRTSMRAFL